MSSTEILARTRNFLDLHRVTVSGQGTATLVLANGFGTDQKIWKHVLPWMERRYRVVRFDWLIDPCHYDASRYATLDGYADDLLALLIATDTPSCLYVGHSMSGMAGMLAAKRAPDRFRHLVMLAPSPCFVNHPGYDGGFEREQIDQLLQELGSDYMKWIEDFSPLAMAAAPDQPETMEFARSLRAMRPDVAFSMALTVFKMDLRNQLAGFTHPATIVQTRDDMAVPMAVPRYLMKHWPQATLEVIDTAGHFPHLTAPAQLVDILARNLPAA
ncbi:MAG: alpha/beta fold hydrolase [Bacteroidales bacterium]